MIKGRIPVVLIVDDLVANRELLEGQLEGQGYDIRHAPDGLEALAMVEAAEPDLILLDVDMPKLDGLAVCRRLKSDPLKRLIPIIITTSHGDRATRLAGTEAGADDFLTKPFDQAEVIARARVLLRDRALNERLDGAEAVVLSLARAVEARDLYTVHHAERVGSNSRRIGVALGLAADDLNTLYKGGVLHDLGKIAVPDAILLKPTALTEAEELVMRRHSVEGERIASPLHSATQLLPVIRHHHERFDGQGYPDHLLGLEIPALARVVAIADSYDAMVNDRPYRRGLSAEEARARLRAGAGSQWDPNYAEVFLQLLELPSSGEQEHFLADRGLNNVAAAN